MFRTLSVVVLALALVVCATSAEERSNVGEGGPCFGGYFQDGKGCCPEVINAKPYWRDSNQCYPKDVGAGIYYADLLGCYPDEHGRYLAAKAQCPKDRLCEQRCIKPGDQSDQPPEPVKDNQPPKEAGSDDQAQEDKNKNKNKNKGDDRKHHSKPQQDKGHKNEEPSPQPRCRNGQEADSRGCCPRHFSGKWYYRDNQGCYPIQTSKYGGLYADANGCYPDPETAQYAKAGERCPNHRRCHPTCDASWRF